MADATKPGLPRSELLLAVAMLGLLAIMLVPLPPWLLDMLLAFNLAMTILVLLSTLFVRQPLDFAIFPSILLLLTLYRLALNIATTRLILLNGEAGEIVQAFGKFVVGGDLVVGLVIFLILVIIQFVVITRGAGRVSEVSARFVLDAMPGKQMAIDAELNAGAIDEPTARKRREALMQESEFYGTMDGASKFVRGDAIAGVIITAVNLIGGIIIGVTKGLNINTAIKQYSILTVGDGLITQIPALIIATASGMLVTKATSKTSLGQEIGTQLSVSIWPLRFGAAIIAGLGLLPGLPMLPFFVLAGILFFISYRVEKMVQPEPPPTVPASAGGPAVASDVGQTPRSPTETYTEEFLQFDRIGLEIGARLFPLVDTRRGPGLLDRVSGLRRDIGRNNGLWVPTVRVRDNIGIDPDGYRILIAGREVARGTVRVGMWLAVNTGGATLNLEGEVATEPVFQMPARWIHETERARAEMAGYAVVDASGVIITHLGEIIRRHAHELLGRDDLKALIDRVRETTPAVVDELLPNLLSMGSLHRILTLLLEERVPISNMTRILESLSIHATTTKNPNDLTELVRRDLGRTICDRYRDDQGRVRAIVFDPRIEIEFRRAITEGQLIIDPSRLEQLLLRLNNEVRLSQARGFEVALLCDSSIRRPLRHAVARSLPDLSVIAFQEIPTDLLMEPVALIRPEDLAGGPSTVAATLGLAESRN